MRLYNNNIVDVDVFRNGKQVTGLRRLASDVIYFILTDV